MVRSSGDDWHAFWRGSGSDHHFWLTKTPPGEPTNFVVILPLNALFELRAEGVLRFWLALAGRLPGDRRRDLPPQTRDRHILAEETIIDRRRRIFAFRPDATFAFVRWVSNDFGTIISRIDIVRAVEPHEPYQTLPFVRPGGDILLKIDGWPKVEQVLRHIDAIQAIGIDPENVSPDHWRHVHNRLTAKHEPRAYTADQHRAFLKRWRIVP